MSRPDHKTIDEMRFITWIGRKVHCPTKLSSRINLLTSYKEALLKRTDWHGMDRLAVLAHIDKEISGEG